MTDADGSAPGGLMINNGNWVHGIIGTAYGTPVSQTDPNLVKAGTLYPYVKNVLVYKCVADLKTVVVGGLAKPVSRSLSMNGWMNPVSPWNGVDYVYRKMGDISRPPPVNCWVFINENPSTINDGFLCATQKAATGGATCRHIITTALGDFPMLMAMRRFISGRTMSSSRIKACFKLPPLPTRI